MRNDHLKIALMGAWILGIGAIGYVSGATSYGTWIGLAVLSLAPPVVAARLWSEGGPSTSESIRDAIR